MDLPSLLFGHSKALYSNWIYYKPDHLLIDCGEGVATALGNGGYAIERILLTHGHIDHIAGLPSLLWSRAAGMGDNEKPLTIYYPEGDLFVGDMRAYLEKTQARLSYDLQWHTLEAGSELTLGSETGKSRGGRRCVAFPTQHIRGRLTLGYKIVETRRRLKPEFADLDEAAIRERVRVEGPAFAKGLSEDYEAVLVAFGGDGLPLDPAPLHGCELLVHEATILDAAERKHQLHSTLDEAIRVAVEVEPRALLLHHVSGRYRVEDVKRTARVSIARHNANFEVWCLYRDRLFKIDAHETLSRRQGEKNADH